MSGTKKIHIGKLLLEKGLISQEQLDHAIARQKETGQRLGNVLVEMRYVEEEKLLHLLSDQLKIPYIDLKDYNIIPDIVINLPEFYARHFRAIVLKKEPDNYLVGMVDPQDIVAMDEITHLLKFPIKIAIVREDDLLHVIDMVYRHTSEISSFAEELSEEVSENNYNIAQLGNELAVSEAPVVKLLQSIFEDAVQMNASDIHIEPDEKILRIRQRLDGVLHEHIIKEKNIVDPLTQRLKLMAGLNITEKRVPQDGRFSIKIKEKHFDVRLSTLPTQFGESVVMRLLNQSGELLDLDHIGMPPEILARLRHIISFPNGLLLITGPTGSGKTTTLYAALSELNDAEKKIITVEDPVEYRLPRINQVQVAPTIELTFARALRSILRQDPDIIMVGELRDEETVAIAIRAAMTGHLVLSTLHTNDALSSTLRLIDMGASAYLVAAVLRGIMAQRLVRRICQNCIKPTTLSPEELAWLAEVVGADMAHKTYFHGKGCNYCMHTGYKGQIGIYELIEWNGELGEALRTGNQKEFIAAAKKQPSFKPLVIGGIDLAVAGITTIDEVIRTTGDIVPEYYFAEPE